MSYKSEDSYLSYQSLLYSTSPQVFKEFEYIITNIETDSEEQLKTQIMRLRYQIVMKDIKMKKLEIDLKKYEWSHFMWTEFSDTFLRS